MSTERREVPRFIGGGAPLHVTRADDGAHAVFVVRGELDRETTPTLATAVRGALAESTERVELDLSGVKFMDSQGLRILLEAKRLAGDTTDLVVVRPSGQVERLLRATGVAPVLGLAD